MISLAAGALLAVSVFDIIPETYEALGLFNTVVSFLSGYLLFHLITRFLFHVCPACAATHTEVNFTAISWAMILAMSIHSFMDGLAIYSGEVTGHAIGIPLLAAVVFHKLPEGLALSLVARSSGISRGKTVLLTVALESVTTLAGGYAGLLFLIPTDAQWVAFVLGHVGGGFIFLVFHALLSEAIKHHPKETMLAALAGGAFVWLIGQFHF